MSRIGKQPIPIPEGVKIAIQDKAVEVTGPKGKVCEPIVENISVEQQDKELVVKALNSEKQTKAAHGLVRALIANAIVGVTTGYQKVMAIVGTGYNARLKGKTLELAVGFILPVTLNIPEGLTVEVPTPIRIVIKGCNKQLVGEFAATIRRVKEPDNYKGKGIRYEAEKIKLKAGKSFAGAGSSDK